MRYAVIIEWAETNYSAYVPDLPGCVSVGDTLEEVTRNIREAIEGHLEVMREYGDPIRPRGRARSRSKSCWTRRRARPSPAEAGQGTEGGGIDCAGGRGPGV